MDARGTARGVIARTGAWRKVCMERRDDIFVDAGSADSMGRKVNALFDVIVEKQLYSLELTVQEKKEFSGLALVRLLDGVGFVHHLVHSHYLRHSDRCIQRNQSVHNASEDPQLRVENQSAFAT